MIDAFHQFEIAFLVIHRSVATRTKPRHKRYKLHASGICSAGFSRQAVYQIPLSRGVVDEECGSCARQRDHRGPCCLHTARNFAILSLSFSPATSIGLGPSSLTFRVYPRSTITRRGVVTETTRPKPLTREKKVQCVVQRDILAKLGNRNRVDVADCRHVRVPRAESGTFE